MAKIFDALRHAQDLRARQRGAEVERDWRSERAFRVVSVVSNKGGVGKTTVAANLAVYARALHEDAPVLLVGFDDQTTIDRMFALDEMPANDPMAAAFAQESFAPVTRLGQYGVEYVPSSRDIGALKRQLQDSGQLQRTLLRSERSGLIVIDTKSDFEGLTQAAVDAADLVIVVVKDHASLVEARRVFDHLERAGRSADVARVLLSLVDLRVKYREGEGIDVLAHLVSEVRREGFPLFESFLSRSPKIESLHTNPEGRALSILHGAHGSVVHRQMRALTEEVLKTLASR